MTIKKRLKIVGGLVLFLTLPSLLFFGYLYLRYNEELPTGIKGEQADALAHKMLNALDYKAYEATNYIEWTFKNEHHYEWQKDENTCVIQWKEYKIKASLNDTSQSKVYVHNFEVRGKKRADLLYEAISYFNNDSFWLVAPYKVFDPNVERSLIKEEGKDALLVTYASGGTTPGDSYLWILDDNGKPKNFKMWTSLLPIDGLPASWDEWITTESGAQLPTNHKLLLFNLNMGEVKATK